MFSINKLYWYRYLLLAALIQLTAAVRSDLRGSDSFPAKDLAAATIVYRRKPGTPDTAFCSDSGNVTCRLPPEFCVGLHIGQRHFITRAHCLVDGNGTIQDPHELDIVGVGKATVNLYLHKEYSEPMGPNVAWIEYENPAVGNYTLEVDLGSTRVGSCNEYILEMFNSSTSRGDLGFRWISKPLAIFLPFPGYNRIGVVLLTDGDTQNVEHAVICRKPDGYFLHNIHYGVTDTDSYGTDCHRIECQDLSNRNVSITTIKMETTVTTAKTTKTPSIFDFLVGLVPHLEENPNRRNKSSSDIMRLVADLLPDERPTIEQTTTPRIPTLRTVSTSTKKPSLSTIPSSTKRPDTTKTTRKPKSSPPEESTDSSEFEEYEDPNKTPWIMEYYWTRSKNSPT